MDFKRSLKDVSLQLLRQLLAPKDADAKAQTPEKVRLEDLSLDDLRREKVRLDQEERKLLARLRDLEKRKKVLFAEGVRNSSEREQRAIARRIKDLDVEARNLDRLLRVVSKQQRILNGLIQIKESARVMQSTGISRILKEIDLQDLILYIDQASVDGEFHLDKFDELIRTLEQADAVSPEIAEDEDVLDIVRAMQEAQAAADAEAPPDEVVERYYDEAEHRLQQRRLQREDDETEGF